MECEIDRRNGAAAAVMWFLYWSVLEKEMSLKRKPPEELDKVSRETEVQVLLL